MPFSIFRIKGNKSQNFRPRVRFVMVLYPSYWLRIVPIHFGYKLTRHTVTWIEVSDCVETHGTHFKTQAVLKFEIARRLRKFWARKSTPACVCTRVTYGTRGHRIFWGWKIDIWELSERSRLAFWRQIKIVSKEVQYNRVQYNTILYCVQ